MTFKRYDVITFEEDDKVVVLDPNGLHSFKKLSNKNIVTFLLVADETIRRERMVSRGDKKENIDQRITNDVVDFSLDKVGEVDFVIKTTDDKKENFVTTYHFVSEKQLKKDLKRYKRIK